MKTIWKFELGSSGKIKMPKGAKIISVGNQGNQLMIWAEVDTEFTEREMKYFDVIGTGQQLYTGMGVQRKFINTVIFNNLGLVWHVYERLE